MAGHPGRSGLDLHAYTPQVMNAILFTPGSTSFVCLTLEGGNG
jgi:hypothetical protein